ncbi:gluconate 2-dehydrogenase subunit 3 family protein [uncultured Croceitalea sp.]|uniref:gluconate 2-dehydrogenase subunit 3 family protein n=1 Tax=uncultured Croceitalea sp. TaxID=1798908 RepID=UPI0033060532
MDRKRFLEQLTVLGGCTLVVPSVLVQSCKAEPRMWSSLSDTDIAFIDELAETIMPQTSKLPGAKDVQVGEYVVMTVQKCLVPEDRDVFLSGLGTIETRCISEHGKVFEDLDGSQKLQLLTTLQEEAITFNEAQEGVKEPEIHYFSLLKELVVSGYLTSKPVMTEVFNYAPIPGRFDGCVDFDKNKDKAYRG